MQDGIKVLIERMESHPEEFFGELAYRWAEIMQDIAKHGPEFLEEDDLLLLNKKVKEVRRKELNAKIMDEIASAERLSHAQEKFAKAGQLKASQLGTYGQAQAKQSGAPIKAWFTLDDMIKKDAERRLDKAFEDAYTEGLKGTMEWLEKKNDEQTLHNIRQTNAELQAQLNEVLAEQAAKDNRSKAYKQRNNQKWFKK